METDQFDVKQIDNFIEILPIAETVFAICMTESDESIHIKLNGDKLSVATALFNAMIANKDVKELITTASFAYLEFKKECRDAKDQ